MRQILPIRHKMYYKMLFIYFIVSVVPIIIIQSSLFRIYSKSMENKVEELIQYNMENIKRNVDEKLNIYENLVYIINADDEFQELVEDIDIEEKIKFASVKNNMRQFLVKYIHMRKNLISINIINNKKKLISYNRRSMIALSSINENQINKLYGSGYDGFDIVLQDNRDADSLFYMVFPIRHLRSRKTMGVMAIGIDQKAITDIFSYNIKDKSIDSYYYIVGEKEEVIFLSDRSKNIDLVDIIDNDNYITKNVKINEYNWDICVAVAKDSILKEVKIIKALILIISSAIVLIVTGVILYFVKSITDSIEIIVKGFKQIQQGELIGRIYLNSKDELKSIEINFNKMVRRLRMQRDEIVELSHRQKEAEIRALEAQINPHFLYNTINCINWMAIDNDMYDISRALKYLAEIMRYSINNSNIITPLIEEVNWLEQYVFLQKMRFKNRFDCVIHIDDEAMNFPIYKLLIQPLIENSIIHGMEDKKSGGIIKVSGHVLEDKRLKLVISDNGRGVNADVLQRIREVINNKSFVQQDEAGIGIFNVIERLKIYYGDLGKIDIDSNENGTSISIIIPKVWGRLKGESNHNRG